MTDVDKAIPFEAINVESSIQGLRCMLTDRKLYEKYGHQILAYLDKIGEQMVFDMNQGDV